MIRLHLKLAGTSQGLDLSLSVSEHDVPSFLLEIPRSNQYGVSHLYPDSSLHLTAYSTDASHTVSAFNQDPVITEQVLDCPVHLSGTWSEHFTQVGFAQNFAFSHFLTLVVIPGNIKPLRYYGSIDNKTTASILWNSRRVESPVQMGPCLTGRSRLR